MRSTTEQGGSHALDTPIDQSSSVVLPRRAMVRQECWIDTHVLPDEPEAEIDVGAAALGQVSLEAFAGFDGASADLRFWGAAAGQDRARVDDRGKACRIGQCAEMSDLLLFSWAVRECRAKAAAGEHGHGDEGFGCVESVGAFGQCS